MPAVSIIIPAYDSQRTLGACLEAIDRQTFTDFEVIIVDSSPTDRLSGIVKRFPGTRLIRSERGLLPFAARNAGIRASRAPVLVSTDPDVYPEPDWLERLMVRHRRTGGPVAGSVTCHGRNLFDQGVHLCKYHESLPSAPPGPRGSAASANLLLTRKMYESVDRPKDDLYCSDYLFTKALAARGHRLWFEPAAGVSHDHPLTWWGYLVDRYRRGREFGETRARVEDWPRRRLWLWLLISIVPVRLARLVFRTAPRAVKGNSLGAIVLALPVAGLGFAAWLGGEAAGYLRTLYPCLLRSRTPAGNRVE
jgi:glycosyltransferase involved in cell wall biosynthesis